MTCMKCIATSPRNAFFHITVHTVQCEPQYNIMMAKQLCTSVPHCLVSVKIQLRLFLYASFNT